MATPLRLYQHSFGRQLSTRTRDYWPGGTARQTDVWMTGPYDSIIGVEKDIILRRFLTALPVRMESARHGAELHAVIVDVDEKTGKATAVRRFEIVE